KDAIERRQRHLDMDRARFEKAAGIAKIIIDTATAVTQALPNIPLSILVGALGAAQLATAIATPIPKYEVGTGYSAEGLAWVGEKGRELLIDPSGNISLTPDNPTLTYLSGGTKVINNQTLERMIIQDQLESIGRGGSKD